MCSSLEHRKSSCPYREGPQPSDGSTTSTVGGGSKGGKNGKGGGKSTRIKGGDEKSTKDGDPKVAAMDGCGKTTSSTTTTTSQGPRKE